MKAIQGRWPCSGRPERGRVDVDRIAEMLGVDSEAAASELAPLVFTDPATGAPVPSEEYLSGDVRRKLAAATAVASTDGRFDRNVEALRAVQPAQTAPGEIVARPGAPWIEASDVAAFAGEILDGPAFAG